MGKGHHIDEGTNENINDPVLIKTRAAKMAAEKEKAKQAELDKKYGSSFMDKLDAEINLKQELQNLKDEREDVLMRIEDIGVETEQTAEPEGGPIADELGERLMAAERELRAIDNKIIDVKDELGYFRMYESDLDEGTCGYGEDGKIGTIPAGAHLQKEESKGDKEIRALEKRAKKYPKGDSRREVIQKKIGDLKSDKDYALPGSKADKKFSDMSDKEIDDEVRRLLKRNFMEEEIETSLTPNEIGDEERANSGVVGETKGFNFKQMVKEALTPKNLK